eukprot:2750898-Karenia_brevis.AAC.1
MVVRTCLDYVNDADASAQTEVQGLSAVAPELRPADIFTNSAVPNKDAAVDITVAAHTSST